MWGAAGPASAWVYPEHRDIAVIAVETLDSSERRTFDDLWGLARAGHEARLCASGADGSQGVDPGCLDWAALPAIAGDHSCSADEMSSIALDSKWVLDVADVAARLKADLAGIDARLSASKEAGSGETMGDLRRRIEASSVRAARINALRKADNRLQRDDPQYATRAGSSNAHFLLARPRTGMSNEEYDVLTLTPGSKINALGVYSWYHLSALEQASRLAHEQMPEEERQALARAILFDEAFALHFLQDSFAAGHIAGTWGDASQRKGTHDFYNEAGLEVFLWNGAGASIVVMGDAHMRREDAERTAAAVRTSLEQLLDTAAGRQRASNTPYTPAAPLRPNGFNVCKNETLIDRPDLSESAESYRRALIAEVGEVLRQTPVPGLGPGLGAMPRFRSEVGPFVGFASAIGGQWLDGGFTPTDGHGFVAGVDLAARFGMGLDGVMGDDGDGLVFLSVGARADASSTNAVANPTLANFGGDISAAIPSRSAVTTRLRMPFYVVPMDLLLLSPLYLVAPEHYQSMAVAAGNGGLIPWQSGIATSIGRFQFVLGREFGVTFYGLTDKDHVVAPPAAAGSPIRVVDFKSTAFDLPIVEYRPYRSFSSNQSSTLMFQLFTDVDVPHSSRVVSPPGAPNIELRDVWSVGIRLVFDWRYYP